MHGLFGSSLSGVRRVTGLAQVGQGSLEGSSFQRLSRDTLPGKEVEAKVAESSTKLFGKFI
jgi:hypothetical protein